jgi:hypothetical protein
MNTLVPRALGRNIQIASIGQVDSCWSHSRQGHSGRTNSSRRIGQVDGWWTHSCRGHSGRAYRLTRLVKWTVDHARAGGTREEQTAVAELAEWTVDQHTRAKGTREEHTDWLDRSSGQLLITLVPGALEKNKQQSQNRPSERLFISADQRIERKFWNRGIGFGGHFVDSVCSLVHSREKSQSRHNTKKSQKSQCMLKIVKMSSTDDQYQYRNGISVKFPANLCD